MVATRNEQASNHPAKGGKTMSDIAFRLMMESGVLRPADRGIRRGPDGTPLRSTKQVSDVVDYAVDMLLGSESMQQKTSNVRSRPVKPAPSHPPAARFSLEGMLVWLGLHEQTNGFGPKVPPAQLLVTRLESQIQELELSLRTEQTRIDVLEAELAIERESSSRLVHWLQEAEQELDWPQGQKRGSV